METTPEKLTDLLQFGPIDLSKKKLPQPFFKDRDNYPLFIENLTKIPGLRESIEGLSQAEAITKILAILADYRANGPQPVENTEKITALEEEIKVLKESAESAETLRKASAVQYEQQLEANATALDYANTNFSHKQTAVNQLEDECGKLRKEVETLSAALQDYQLEANQIVLNVDPQLLATVKHLLPDFVQRGYIRKGDDPSVFFNKAAWEFVRIFYGIEVQPLAKPQPTPTTDQHAA